MSLTREELERYSRQIVLGEIGLEGQKKLKESRVSIIGIGGLGCFSSVQLVSMGVGHIRLVDQDVVERSNLHRQILFDTDSLGYPKVEVAQRKLKALNPNVETESLPLTVNEETADDVVKDVDVVVDGLDHLGPRYAINRACVKHGIPYVYAGALETYGSVSTIIPKKSACLECFTGTLKDESLPTCETVGVFTPVLAAITSVQVSETLRLLLKREPVLANKVLFVDAYSLSFSTVDIVRREDCQVCGTPSIKVEPSLKESKVVALCGKDSFMASPRSPMSLDMTEVSALLGVRFKIERRSILGITFEYRMGVSISLMKTGNALIKGVSSEGEAMRIYDKLLALLGDRS